MGTQVMSGSTNGKPPLPPNNALVPSGFVNEMGEGHPLSPSVERLSAGTGASPAEMALWAREAAADAARCRAELAAINAENKRRWRR
jgi:hypothetical protein